MFSQQLVALHYEALDRAELDLLERVVDQLPVVLVLILLEVRPPLLLYVALRQSDHALDRVEIGTVAGVQYQDDL